MINKDYEVSECDVLVAGGGIAGLMAAIAAAQKGAKVIVAEKANTLRSGSGATGCDHFFCYIPEEHGDFATALEELSNSQGGQIGRVDPALQKIFLERTHEVAEDWLRWGINMKPHGKWEFNGHTLPGHTCHWLKYDGKQQKPILTKVAKENGVIIDNKTVIQEFLLDKDKKICGAISLDVSNDIPAIKIYKTQSIVVSTGIAMRLYPSITPGWIFNACNCPAGTATGRAAAFKAGASLVNMDILWVHSGLRYFERVGKSTWIGVMKDSEMKQTSPFVKVATKEKADITGDIWGNIFPEKMNNGTGPVFMDCTETSDDDKEYMKWGMACEGCTSVLELMNQSDIDLDKHMVEFGRYNPILQGNGIQINTSGESDIEGLYCAGDELGNFNCGIAGAAVTGRIAGENAAEFVKSHKYTLDSKSDNLLESQQIRDFRELCETLTDRKEGAHWSELNLAIQQVMDDYCGLKYKRSRTMMSAGLSYLKEIEKRAKLSIKCDNSHELMRALESFDLLLMGKIVISCALERKESRGMHQRADYTYTNPLLNKQFLAVRQENGELKFQWREKF
ncbi:FAD-dependent oxidoreductase [Peptococcus simiae]|uniref:FAD-dependent oxidoreductase n=1 Tax=Peptococcus simiae TaxID=1643805 RepID=A0ABW9GZX7_9FIRM